MFGNAPENEIQGCCEGCCGGTHHAFRCMDLCLVDVAQGRVVNPERLVLLHEDILACKFARACVLKPTCTLPIPPRPLRHSLTMVPHAPATLTSLAYDVHPPATLIMPLANDLHAARHPYATDL
jgi:hypothetical protein